MLARWHPAIGDPTVFGWLTVAAYALAVCVAGVAVSRAASAQHQLDPSSGQEWRDRRAVKHFWVGVLAILVVLGINKQLDLQSLLIEKVRNRAYTDGWYASRRRYQMDFILVMFVGAIGVAAGIAFWLRRVLASVAWAIAGLATLMLFVLVRASSFHYVDKVLALGDGVNINEVLELGGIAILVGAMFQWIGAERHRRRTDTDAGRSLTPHEPSVGAGRL